MSIQMVAWALEQNIPDASAKLVLISLCNAHNRKTERCDPSYSIIAVEASCSKRTAMRKIRYLEEQGWIEVFARVDAGGNVSNSYRIQTDTPSDNLTPPLVTGCHPPSDTVVTPNKELTGNIDKRKNTKKEILVSILQEHLSEEVANAVFDHRKEIRKPLTERGAKLLANEFSKTSDPNAAADTMIMNGWQGFRAEWVNDKSEKSNAHTMIDALAKVAAEGMH